MTNEHEQELPLVAASSATSGGDDDRSQASRDAEEFDRLCDEASALALYIARHGDSLNDAAGGLHDGLLKAISDARSSRSSGNWQALMQAYAKVTEITYRDRGVNGRTIPRYTEESSREIESLAALSENPPDGARRYPLRHGDVP